MALFSIVLAGVCLTWALGVAPQARHPGIALEVSPGGELLTARAPRGSLVSGAKPLMRTESQAVAASGELAAASAVEDSDDIIEIGPQLAEASPGVDTAEGSDDVAETSPQLAESSPAAGIAEDADESGHIRNGADDALDGGSIVLAGVDATADAASLAATDGEFIPGIGVNDVAYKASDMLLGITGIGDEMDYPYACICGPDGHCVGDPMATTCNGRAGSGSGA